MENRYRQRYTVLPGVCDHRARLSYADAFMVCQDLATSHACLLGVGVWDMAARDLFWLTVRTKLHFYERPKMMEQVELRTWPIAPEKLRGLREYRIERDGQLLIEGKTEWAVMETKTGKLHRVEGIFPPELDPVKELEYAAPFVRVAVDFSDGTLLGTHTVGSGDIDLGQHMNNVAYLRALLGLFPTKQLDEMPIGEIELSFRSSCFEGDTLRYYTRPAENGLDFAAFTEGPKPVLLGRISYAS